ncbi:hypothetical protein PVT67_05870 [Gallaecimonas kandeliae]|uniref:hypothetical protein n=1 Tax=Gallaecimonas kandeliae TaxID=3029055 RepID=UPI00264A34FE|nr:hypothetical protein [Gallaecimonas kandeliae]WKE66767.1 hypothetical protein PVT67_05870 [Gallaecimonas kandeliae]
MKIAPPTTPPPAAPSESAKATGQPRLTLPLAAQAPLSAEGARLAIGLTLPSPDGAALAKLLPELALEKLPQLLTSLLLPAEGKSPAVRQWLLGALAARLANAGSPLPPALQKWLSLLSDDAKALLNQGLGRLEQAQVQSSQDNLFWALPLPWASDWLELAWPKKKRPAGGKAEEEPVLTLLFPIPGLGRLLVKAGVQQLRFYADSPALKARVDETLPRLARRLADLNLTPALHSFQGKVPKRLMPPVGGINELV